MTVLGDLAHRLKTDLGELARASQDPVFSEKRDRMNFRREVLANERTNDLEDAARIRREKLTDQAKAEKLTTQRYAVTKLFDVAMNDPSGDGWDRYMELGNSQRLEPEMQDAWSLLAEGAGGQSLKSRQFEWEQDQAFKAQTAKQQELALKVAKYTTDRDQKNAEIALKEKKFRFEKMQAFADEKDAVRNRRSMIEFVRETPDITNEAERKAFENRLTMAEPSEIITVWNEIMDRHGKRLDRASREHNARMQARAAMGPITTDASSIELSIAEQALKQQLGSEFDDAFFDVGERTLMVESLGSKINFYSRKMRKDQTDPAVIDKALSEVLPNYELGSFFGLDDPSFKLPENTTITTQEEYDALPSGTKYINAEDGKTYEKP